LSEVYAKYIEEGFNGFVAVIVTAALSHGNILVIVSAMSCARRLYDDTWREERVTVQSRGGCSAPQDRDPRRQDCSRELKRSRLDARRPGR